MGSYCTELCLWHPYSLHTWNKRFKLAETNKRFSCKQTFQLPTNVSNYLKQTFQITWTNKRFSCKQTFQIKSAEIGNTISTQVTMIHKQQTNNDWHTLEWCKCSGWHVSGCDWLKSFGGTVLQKLFIVVIAHWVRCVAVVLIMRCVLNYVDCLIVT